MKKFLVILIIFFSNVLSAQDNALFDSVISKLESDSKAYEQFVNLGKIYCTDRFAPKNTDLFTENYLKLFNALQPFPRFIDQNILEKQYKIVQKKIKKDKCSCFYSVENKELKAIYVKIVQDKKSYHDNDEYNLDEDMDDYLKYGKIDSNRFE